ncbi:MAG: hypothetical protein GY749_01560 [Desulfobacteraceae bacterium]|nr:hypothetical protein [Desulfobacteraceae bacterium]
MADYIAFNKKIVREKECKRQATAIFCRRCERSLRLSFALRMTNIMLKALTDFLLPVKKKKPTRANNNFYYIDYWEDCDPDCVADITKPLDFYRLPPHLFSIVILECINTACFDKGLPTMRNAVTLVRNGGGIMVTTGTQELAQRAAQRMQEVGVSNPSVTRQTIAMVFTDEGQIMAEHEEALMVFRMELDNYSKSYGSNFIKQLKEAKAEINKDYWVTYGLTK